jgi:RNA polymerase sigma factor (sigma-70 family)
MATATGERNGDVGGGGGNHCIAADIACLANIFRRAQRESKHSGALKRLRGVTLPEVLSGGERTFEAFYAQHFEQVARVVFGLVDSTEEAFDIAQEAFLRTWAQWPRLCASDRDPRRFTVRVAVNLATSRLRRLIRFRHRMPRLLALEQNPSAEDVASSRIQVIEALRKLSPRQRVAIVLCEGLGLSSAEAASLLEISDATLRVHLVRARERLRRAYGPDASTDIEQADRQESFGG